MRQYPQNERAIRRTRAQVTALAEAPVPEAGGANWSSGSGAPSGGSDGDWYVDTATEDIYQKSSGTWVLRVSNIMAVGEQGYALDYQKTGTASEAIGVQYSFQKDAGMPGAYSLGSPGVNGWWVDASTANNAANPAGAAQVGAHQLPTLASGNYWLNDIGICTSVAHLVNFFDIVWYNTGVNVTTTTAQAISMPGASKPARDLFGTTDGHGWIPAILVTGATTNAGAITNTTLAYTSSDGTTTRTATIPSFPATAVIGTLVPFALQAGDRGVRDITGITLGTSYGGGSISLVLLRKLASVPNPIVNVGGIMNKLVNEPTGVKLYNGTALFVSYVSSATTATVLSGTVQVVAR